MALHLTKESLKRDAATVARETATPAGVAAVAGLMSHSVVSSLDGAPKLMMGTACVGGGLWAAARGKGKYLPYAGVGVALGAVWCIFDGRRY